MPGFFFFFNRGLTRCGLAMFSLSTKATVLPSPLVLVFWVPLIGTTRVASSLAAWPKASAFFLRQSKNPPRVFYRRGGVTFPFLNSPGL